MNNLVKEYGLHYTDQFITAEGKFSAVYGLDEDVKKFLDANILTEQYKITTLYIGTVVYWKKNS